VEEVRRPLYKVLDGAIPAHLKTGIPVRLLLAGSQADMGRLPPFLKANFPFTILAIHFFCHLCLWCRFPTSSP